MNSEISYLQKHRTLIFIIGLSVGFIGLFLLITKILYFSSWYLWNSVINILISICSIIFIVCFFIYLYLLWATIKQNNRRISTIIFSVIYIIISIFYVYSYSRLNTLGRGYINEGTVIDKCGEPYCNITIQDKYTGSEVKLYCNIMEYNLIYDGGNYTAIYYTLYDGSNNNVGVLNNMALY